MGWQWVASSWESHLQTASRNKDNKLEAAWVSRLLQSDSSNMLLPAKPHTPKTTPNSTTRWEPSAQMPDLMKAISDSNNYKVSRFLMSWCTSEWHFLLVTLLWRTHLSCPDGKSSWISPVHLQPLPWGSWMDAYPIARSPHSHPLCFFPLCRPSACAVFGSR